MTREGQAADEDDEFDVIIEDAEDVLLQMG